ncbi:MAG: hypothetical protein ACI36X_04125 [Bacteroidaceae bacterium]
MDVQEVIVVVIALLCAARIGRHLYRLFTTPRGGAGPCAHCSGGCALRQQGCDGKPGKSNEKCSEAKKNIKG